MPLSKMVIVPFERYKRLVDGQKEENTCQEEAGVETTSSDSNPLQIGAGVKQDTPSKFNSRADADGLPPQPPPGEPDAPLSEELMDKEQAGSRKSWLDIWRPLPAARK